MNRERVQQAIDILRAVPPSKFDLEFWARVHGDKAKPEPQCLTAGCAMGWIASDPRVIAEGMYLQRLPTSWNGDGAEPVFGDAAGFDAAELWFGVSEGAAELLFDPECYAVRTDPQEVVARLQILLAEGEEGLYSRREEFLSEIDDSYDSED